MATDLFVIQRNSDHELYAGTLDQYGDVTVVVVVSAFLTKMAAERFVTAHSLHGVTVTRILGPSDAPRGSEGPIAVEATEPNTAFDRYSTAVRARLSLLELVEQSSPRGLVRLAGGGGILCCSPLRKDNNPSFSVSKNTVGEYIAFDHATRESFDLFSFVQKREGLSSRVAAVRWCGERVGLPWDESWNR